jgi:hypothetical protein
MATPSTRVLVVGVNSFASPDDEKTYLDPLPSVQTAIWYGLTDKDKDAYQLKACTAFNRVSWRGYYAHLNNQVLVWPRIGVWSIITGKHYTYASLTDLPDWLIHAQCLEALAQAILDADTGLIKRSQLIAQGIVGIRVGSLGSGILEETYTKDAQVRLYPGGLISKEASLLISPFLQRNYQFTSRP